MKEIHVTGWKGEDQIRLEPQDDGDILLIQHRKEKHGGEIKEIKTIVKKEDIRFLWNIIKEIPYNTEYKSPYFWRKIIESKGLDVSIDAFAGGKNRARYYFRYFYYPTKILESQGLIIYAGKGGITRI